MKELTARQVEVITMLDQGMTQHQIADKLAMSRSSVQQHINGAQKKLGVTTARELPFAYRQAIAG